MTLIWPAGPCIYSADGLAVWQSMVMGSVVQRIIHFDVSNEAKHVVHAAAECMIYFWSGDRAIGQHLDQGAPGRSIDVSALAAPLLNGWHDSQSVAPAEKQQVPATVVICTRDRPDELARCLASIPNQTVAPLQVVVVDNASRDDRTRDVAQRAGVTYVRENRPGLDFARNSGALAAEGDFVVYTDDDVHLHPRWLEKVVAAFDDPYIMAVTGLVLPAELETEAQWHFEKHWSFARGYRRIDFDADFFSSDKTSGCPAWEVGAGANMAFRRETFERVGFFDERLDVGQAGCSGDSEFWHRILSHGGVCRYEPEAIVFHYHRRDMTALASQLFHYMRGHSAALMVQFERTGNRGNLRRALLSTPRWYLRRMARALIKGPTPKDRFLRQEVHGYVSGLAFYMLQPKPKTRGPAP